MVPSDSESPEVRYALGPSIIGDPSIDSGDTETLKEGSYLHVLCSIQFAYTRHGNVGCTVPL